MSVRMDIHKPYDKLGPTPDPDYCRQNGLIYCWSESNLGYELAWWLTPEGDSIAGQSEHVANLLRDRPFDREWLK